MFWDSCTNCIPWTFPLLFPILFPILFMFFFGRGIFGRMPSCFRTASFNSGSDAKNDNSPLNRLKIRYANGEITTDQFEEIKARIEG